MRLKTQYSISMVLLISLIVSFMSVILFYQFNKSVKLQETKSIEAISDAILLQMSKRGEFITRYFSTHLNDHIYYEDQERITLALQSSLSQQDLLFVEVFDSTGHIINDGTVELWRFGKKVNDSIMLNAIQQSDEIYSRMEKDKIIFASSIKLGDEIIGGIHLGFSLIFIQEDIKKMKNSLQNELHAVHEMEFKNNIYIVLIAVFLFLIIGVTLAIFIANKLTKPILLLAQYARETGKGDHQSRITLDRKDELGQLATIFNEMNARLLKSKQELHYQAFHDRLTGLANRNLFHQYLDQSLQDAAVQEKYVAVLFLDLDGFKAINDTHGHEVGDQLLVNIANRFNSVIRKKDLINNKQTDANDMLFSRIGGDEFTLILQDISNKKIASRIANRIITSVAQPIELNGKSLSIGVSIGISFYPSDGMDADTLVKHADNAMYRAKGDGKGRYVFFDEAC